MTLSVLIISGISNVERQSHLLQKTSKEMFNHYIAPLTLSLKVTVSATRQRKPDSSYPRQCSANNSCLLHKTACKEFRYQESWQQLPTHTTELQENRWHFFCRSKEKTKREVSTLTQLHRLMCCRRSQRRSLTLQPLHPLPTPSKG